MVIAMEKGRRISCVRGSDGECVPLIKCMGRVATRCNEDVCVTKAGPA